jgi:uncharacterized membrane protein YdjX (TVP38/TMEM64 family)
VTRIALLVVLAAAIAFAWSSGLYVEATPDNVAVLIDRAGILGPIAFVALFAAAEVVHVPGALFVIAASVLWPPAVAIPTAYAGALAAALLTFLIARRIVPASLRERLPARLLRHEARLETHALPTVIGLRLVLFMSPAVHWVLGASRVSFRDYALGSAIGLLPGVIGLALVGREAVAHWQTFWPWILAGAALLVLAAIVRRVRARSLTPS